MVVADRPGALPGGGRPARQEPTPRTSAPATSRPRACAKGNPNIKAGSKVKIDGDRDEASAAPTSISSCVHLFQGSHGYRTHLLGHRAAPPRSLVDLMTPKGKRGWGNSVVIGDRHEQQRPRQARPRARQVPGARRATPRAGGRGSPPSDAGSSRGLLMMPQVGDEVVIGFEHDDVHKPYVLGSLWNGTGEAGRRPRRPRRLVLAAVRPEGADPREGRDHDQERQGLHASRRPGKVDAEVARTT